MLIVRRFWSWFLANCAIYLALLVSGWVLFGLYVEKYNRRGADYAGALDEMLASAGGLAILFALPTAVLLPLVYLMGRRWKGVPFRVLAGLTLAAGGFFSYLVPSLQSIFQLGIQIAFAAVMLAVTVPRRRPRPLER